MAKVELPTIEGEQANTAGEYFMHLRVAVDLLNLAFEQDVIDESTLDTMVHDFRNAQNAWEVFQAQSPLTRLLYREAVDYSDILFKHGTIDHENYRALKANISRGKKFTGRDLEDADHIDSVGARAASGLESPREAGQQILEGLRQMELRKKCHPPRS